MGRDWEAWHAGYDDPTRSLSARLPIVIDGIRRGMDAAPPGPFRVASLCAGDGRDLATAAADHPRRSDVRARLVELDPHLADRARQRLRVAGIEGEVITADAGHASVLDGFAPVEVLLLCGIFGNISDLDVRATIDAVPMLCAPAATIIWTRHRRSPDLVPSIRSWFEAIDCQPLDLTSPGTDGFAVGVERFGGAPRALDPTTPLFRFVDGLW